jgi:hypothetical protein
MANFEIVRAQRSQARLRLGLTGPSGGGKTWSSLLVAKGIVEALLAGGGVSGTIEGKIGLIDTERKSAQLYSHLVPFDCIEMEAPYSVDRYLAALRQFEKAGYLVVVIDQVTHAWSGVGGLLEVAERLSKGQGQNSFNAWATATPEYQRFVDGLLASPCHLICTMRQKTKWELTEKQNASGRMVKSPTRIGLAPEMRAGFEYEFTTLLGLSVEGNVATCLKDRSQVFGEIGEACGRLDESWGRRLTAWLTTGAVLTEDPDLGPPLDRMAAVAAAGTRRINACQTGPDLARVFEAVYREVRRFREELERGVVDAELAGIQRTYERAKAGFPDLQAIYQRSAVAGAAAGAAEQAARKPAPDGAQGLVDREAVRRHGADLISAALGPEPPPADAFAGMKDDLPWQDD